MNSKELNKEYDLNLKLILLYRDVLPQFIVLKKINSNFANIINTYYNKLT